MADTPPTFSESWYRIADQRISLRAGVRVRRQFFRGEQWQVVEDPFCNQFFRLRPAAYAFVGRLRSDRTVQQVWSECLEKDPDNTPGQEEVLRLITQLYFANLLQYEAPMDSARLFERYQRRRERETRSRWLNIMFMRIPLVDPDEWLNRWRGLARLLFSPFSLLIWLAVVGIGIQTAVNNFGQLRQQSQGVLAPGNLFLLYVGLVTIKALHEFGHAFACKRFGGEVHIMGIMLLIFTPTPYMDATASWGFRSRWQRILVGLAGILVEVFMASLAVLVWANTGPGTLHNLAYNMIFVASVSTIVFNGNPLLRYDGYYILSDLLEIPNLYQRAGHQLKFWVERYGFGLRKAEKPAAGRREAAWLGFYGVLSSGYRVVVFGGILLFVADRFLLVGIVMVLACAFSWVIVPIGRLAHYLVAHPGLERHRLRAVLVCASLLFGLLGFLGLVPFPSHFRAPGLLEAQEKSVVVNETAGFLEAVNANPGQRVTAGQPLMRLKNPELEKQLASALARRSEIEAMRRQALSAQVVNLKPIDLRLESVNQQIRRLQADEAGLVITARQDGLWTSPEVEDFIGRWLPRGTDLGLVLNPRAFYFTATVAQTEVARLFNRQIRSAAVRLRGQAGTVIPTGELRIIPAAQKTLPSAALGWMAGGEVRVAPNDPQGRQATEPFFEVKAAVQPAADVVFFHGRAGKIRFDLGPEPLLQQWWRRLRQLLQKRYQL